MKFQGILETLNAFFYPSFCLHCETRIYGKRPLLCKECQTLIEWVESSLTCDCCGKMKSSQLQPLCFTCRKQPVSLMPYGSCLTFGGPAYSLYYRLRAYEDEMIAKLFASFLVLKWKKLGFPFPEVIIPLPESRLEIFSYKHQPSYLIGKKLALLFCTRFKPILKIEEEKGKEPTYPLKRSSRASISNRSVLLVTAIHRKNEPLIAAKESVLSLSPKAIYTLALFDKRSSF